ncbi:2-succinyl-5-enolpyruvyl-6-hydroxy-3-cyclohexene-1-carboxylic-acid synthase [Candidatus Venteria ishoeyi]|uniref:2-succinyl-5-enolpyruvyl-6-hydroxy-3-cyclohexene-1-carboxylate synthase n=1 Tax=Candidatus Venteria ishoeyi TaxID=1899563 RepID=A0A1H6FDH1_9GAMM|nr:2-succinyl-5-enolpyruvyl-6-hydroxy-3-cyclohexene-1-carboxylic-acid synthase [Candidatus Venteria ishoeyi]SEH08140.1 2-succinyl-5-enolpyruvyl-6-hydroxy-3-cyclohexene-1-carboxylate synthase [Candidatus Venteria ishoeyi]
MKTHHYITLIPEICYQHGVQQAVISPGSRSAPLTLAFSRHPHIHCHTVVDERSAAYLALGMAQQSQSPVVLICTSGTAALNYAPAIAEAFYQQVPLLVLTADRPGDWLDQRDGQTIRQTKLYGPHVKTSATWPVDLNHSDARWFAVRILSDLLINAKQQASGPVHLNVPLREPLYPEPGELPGLPEKFNIIQAPLCQSIVSESAWPALIDNFQNAQSILLLSGQLTPQPALAEAVIALAKKSGSVILAELLSNLSPTESVCQLSDRSAASWSAEPPELLISFGQSVLSKKLKKLIRQYPPRQHWHIEAGADIADTFQSMTQRISADPVCFFHTLQKKIKPQALNPVAKRWQMAHQANQHFIQACFKQQPYSEAEAVAQLIQAMPPATSLHLANSLSVRYACLLGIAPPQGAVWANRGTSGIDGCLATAIGHSLLSDKLHLLIIGDMAFQYGRNALWLEKIPSNLRIVVLNNGGGRIFEMLDDCAKQPECEEYFVTRQQLNCQQIALEYALAYQRVTTRQAGLQAAKWLAENATQARLVEICLAPEDNKRVYLALKHAHDT